MKESKNIAVIFAGGKGSRMGANIPKQFLKIYGKDIIIHTLEKFQYNNNIDLIYVGCIKEYIPYLESLVKRFNITKIPVGGIIPGGVSGQDTIYRVLKKAQEENFDNSIVLIHDFSYASVSTASAARSRAESYSSGGGGFSSSGGGGGSIGGGSFGGR